MRYALVTGAGGGMGKATVEALVAQGYYVFALDRTAVAPKENVHPIAVDITDENSLTQACDTVEAVTKKLHAIIHFAGIYRMDSLVEMETEQFSRIFSVNLGGAFLVNKIFLHLMEQGGRIIITTSELAPLDPLPFTGVYAVSKAALDRYAYSLRMELQLLSVSVSVLRAGAVDTDMIGASTTALDAFCNHTGLYSCNAARFRRIVNGVEARRIPPAKVADKVARILSKRRPRFAYAINRNPLLLMLNALPCRMQFWIIRKILK